MNASHTNSEGERIAIETRKLRGVTLVHCLVIYDDAPPHGSGKAAPMLLDKSTREWLKTQIATIEASEVDQ